MPDFSLDGQVALITGGAGGIGQVYGRAIASAGGTVVLADIDGARAAKLAAELTTDGFRALGVPLDVTSPDQADAACRRAVEVFGHLDILVNNAALMSEIPFTGGLSTFSLEWWNRVFEVNVTGALTCAQAAVPHMQRREGGRIVNQMSAGAFQPGGVYSVSKYALFSLTMNLATELGPQGINVNAIAPGLVRDEAGLKSLPEGVFRDAYMAQIPGQKEGVPEDLCGALLLLLSPAGKWINGQVLCVDGGWIMRF